MRIQLYLIPFILLVFPISLSAQIIQKRTSKVAVVPNQETYYLLGKFGVDSLFKIRPKEAFNIDAIVAIELVYSDYRLEPKFDQNDLNNRRWKVLEKWISPSVISKVSKFEVRQDIAKSAESAKQLFHGFRIRTMKNDTYKEVQEDLKFLDKMINPKHFPTMVINEDGSGYRKYDSIKDKLRIKPNYYYPDSTVLNAFSKLDTSWKELLVISDMTGSMRFYTAQTLEWLNEWSGTKKLNSFVFFNDGNGIGVSDKSIGSTGGLYDGYGYSYPFIAKQANACINNRGSNDFEENDLEAVLYGINKYSTAEHVVMIVDNRSPIRDLSLMDQIQKPVHLILCHTAYGLSLDYLNMAYKTGGSIHTVNGSIFLDNIEDGYKLGFNEFVYELVDGVFIKQFN